MTVAAGPRSERKGALIPESGAHKPFGEPWIAAIPAHWDRLRMKRLFHERIEKGFPNEPLLAATQTKGVVPKEMFESRTVLALKDLHLLKLVRPGDFVISLRSFQGGIEYARHQGIISPAYTVLTPTPAVVSGYFAAVFKSRPYVQNLSLFVTGIRQGQNIDYEKLGRSLLPLPPVEEQEAIARFVQHADSHINRLIRAKRRLIELLNEQKQAIVNSAVTRGLDPGVRLKPSGIDWLGDVPEHWEVRRAKDVCSAIIDCKNRTPDVIDDGDYIVVRTSHVKNGRLDLTSPTRTDKNNYETWTQRGAPRVGDVFFTREAPTGEACLVPENDNLCMGQRMMYLRPDPDQMAAEFLLLSIYGPVVRRYVDIAANGSTVGHLRLGQVSAMPLLLCSMTEQSAIIEHITSETRPIDLGMDRTRREIDLIREYRTRLIADVVTGKLDVRGVELPPLDDDDTNDSDLSGEDAEELIDDGIGEGGE